jgi:putative tricarboxylic transport membrane protein
MNIMENLLGGFESALQPINLLFALVGVLLGTVVGVLPGLGPSATLAILLPLTFGLPPTGTLIMMAGTYYGAKYGGSTTAILLNIPGESASVLTAIDGYALAKQGRAGAALGIAAISSFVAGTVGVIGLSLLAPAMAKVAVSFGPPEFFGLMFFGLATVVMLSGDSVVKGAIAACVGLLLSTVGSDLMTGQSRLVFAQIHLLDGISFVIVAVGLFAMAEVLSNVRAKQLAPLVAVPKGFRALLPTKQDLKDSRFAMAQSSVLGFLIGVLPGAGATIASFVSYGVQKKFSPNKAIFGKGAIDGVAAPEGANNSETGGAMVPLLTLGIPGSASTAIMLAALLIYGLQPGPRLFTEQPELVWALIASMYIGNLICVALNLPLAPFFARILRIPYGYLYPAICMICVVGVYGLKGSIYDVGIFFGFALLGYVFKLVDIPPAPLLLAFVLGSYAERSLAQSLIISSGDWSIFMTRPISATLIGIALLLLISTRFEGVNIFRKKVLEEED